MADILASMAVRIGADINEFDRAVAAVKKELNGLVKLGERMQGVGQSLSLGLSAPLLAGGVAAVKMAGDMEKAQASFATMLGSAESAKKTLGELKQFAADTPFEFPELQAAAKKLLAFNTPAAELKGTLRQLGDVAAGIDAPIGEIAELFGKARVQGRLFQEDINQLTGRGIPIIQELAKQFGVTDGEVKKLVESGKVNFGNLQQAFADLTGEGGKFAGLMAAQSQTLPGLFSSLSDNVGQALAGIGADIAQSLNLKEVIADVSAFVRDVADRFAGLSPEVKKVIVVGAALVAALGPVLFALGGLLTVLPAVGGAFAVLAGPVGLTAAAVAAGAALIVGNWDTLVAYFTTGPAGRVFAQVQASAQAAFAAIGRASDALAPVSGVLNALLNPFGALAGRFDATAGASDRLGAAFRAALAPAALFRGALDQFVAPFQVAGAAFSAFADLVANGAAAVADALQGNLKRAAAEALAALNTLSNPLGALLDKLNEPPKSSTIGEFFKAEFAAAGQSAQQAAEVVAAATVKANGAVVGLTEEQSKALAKLRAELLNNENASRALGPGYDFVGTKAKILEGGVKSLTDVGFAPQGRTVQGLLAQMRGLATAYDQLAPKLAQGVAAPKVEQRTQAFDVDLPQLPEQVAAPLSVLIDVAAAKEQAAQLAGVYASLSDGQKLAIANAAEFNAQLEPLLVGGLQNMAAGVGEAVGAMLANAGGMELVGAALLSGVGDMAVQLGKLAIGIGIATFGIKAALESLNPVAAIAGGIALVALGTAVKGAARSIAGGGGGGGAVPGGGASAVRPAAQPQRQPEQRIKIELEPVTFRQKGPDLDAVVGVNQYRRLRVS